MTRLENKTFDEIAIGDTASLSRELSEEDIQLFAIVSGDVNPAHLDKEFAKNDPFHEIIGHGMWTGALISTVLGTLLPGPGTIYLSQSLSFKSPVLIGDKIHVEVEVIAKKESKPIVTLACRASNQRGEDVVTGEAVVMAPTEKVVCSSAKLPNIELGNDVT